MAEFQDPALKAEGHSIRLLRIIYDREAAPTACKIYSFTLDECPPYVAVSYSWGISRERNDISLNDMIFLSTINHF